MLDFKLTNLNKNSTKYFIIGFIFNLFLLIPFFIEISFYFEPISNFNCLCGIIEIICWWLDSFLLINYKFDIFVFFNNIFRIMYNVTFLQLKIVNELSIQLLFMLW